MHDDEDDKLGGGESAGPLAAEIARAASGPAADEARDYLRKQSRLTDLQIENLQKLDRYETSHLRWRRFNDQMKGAMQVLIVALGLLIVIGIAFAVWGASQADGTVVEAFSVPPSFAQNGIGGDVIANDMTNKLGAIRDIAEGNSLSRSKSVSRDSANDIKVEIPDTGISLGEAARYLRGWLGSERRLSGNLRAVGENRIALTAAVDGKAKTFTGSRGDLDGLEQQAAEWVFSTVDPVNIVLYLWSRQRANEALAAIARYTRLASDTPLERSDSYSLWANMVRDITGDIARSQSLAEASVAIDSKTVAPHMELLHDAHYLGHDEEVLRQARIIPTKRIEDETPQFQKVGFAFAQELGRFALDTELGDFTQATREKCEFVCTPASAVSGRAEYFARLHDPAKAQALLDEARAIGAAHDVETERARYFSAVAVSNWHSAVAAAHDYEADERFTPPGQTPTPRFNDTVVKTLVDPILAIALARSGDVNGARKAIGSSPLDCYDCLRARGVIEGAAKNWAGAASWFARAVKAAPSIPYAYADWGGMLRAKGDLDDAIAKFATANQKGPHFADPLEMWGEALIAKNRSDLALAKFEEAAKYAPNWGRLHLKWGEALSYTRDHVGAQKQFATAARLDLTPSEKMAVEHWIKHG